MTARVVLLLLGALPSAAWACPSCADPKDPTQAAFLGPTIFMSLLPLAMMAGIFSYQWWAMRRPMST